MAKKAQLLEFSGDLAQTLTYIQRLASSMMKNRADALIQGKITFPQYIALEVLHTDEPLKMKSVAKALRISLPAATGLINRLVSMKLVKRAYDEEDRRVIFITLTEEGKKITEKTRVARKKIIAEIFSVLTEKERQAYLTIIHKIKKAFYGKDKKK